MFLVHENGVRKDQQVSIDELLKSIMSFCFFNSLTIFEQLMLIID